MLSLDVTFYTTPVALWGVGEMTIGFLVLGIPSIPKVVQSLPFPGCVASFVRCFRRTDSSGDPRGGYYWPKFVARKPRDQWQISDVDTHDLFEVKSSEASKRGEIRVQSTK
jgi:hypothetical protein